MALAAYNKDLSISHLHGINGVTEKIKKAMYESAKQFVYIGFLLKEVRDYGYYEEGGYENVYAYAEFELGFKKSSTKNFIAIAETFGIKKWEYQGIMRETQSMSLQPAYENFNYSQLVELLAMSDTQRKQAKPDMTVKQLREIKKQPEKVEQVTIEELEAQLTGQTSGHQKEPTIEEIEKEDKKLQEQYGIEANIVRINGKDVQITHYVMKELCELAGMKYIDWEDYEITIKITDIEALAQTYIQTNRSQ